MQTIDSTRPTVRSVPSPLAATRITSNATPCTRVPSRVPRRRSTRAFTTGQLACEDYVRAVTEARTTGVWL
jgi:hypothetical protein